MLKQTTEVSTVDLTTRQKQILRAIVESYIQSAEPVGSKAIAAMPDIECSSATIRNEMAALTEMGLLEQPHTSAGRVPSPAGYRLYVNELMQDYHLSMDETQTLNQAMEGKLQQVDQLLSGGQAGLPDDEPAGLRHGRPPHRGNGQAVRPDPGRGPQLHPGDHDLQR